MKVDVSEKMRSSDRITNAMLDKVKVYEHDGTTQEHMVIGDVRFNNHEMSRLLLLLEWRLYGREFNSNNLTEID